MICVNSLEKEEEEGEGRIEKKERRGERRWREVSQNRNK